MTAETEHKLIYMANQIARNFAALGHDNAVAATLDHIVKFWDPRMKAQIVVLAAEGAGHFEPITAAALVQLRKGVEPPPQTRATKFAEVDETGRSDAG